MSAMNEKHADYQQTLADGLDMVLANKDAEIAKWKQIAYNLSCALELNHLNGIASLRQQMDAHGVTP